MNKKHIGSDFDDFLAEEAMLQETTAVAIKRVIAWQIAQEMQTQHLTKTALAKKMHKTEFASDPGSARDGMNACALFGGAVTANLRAIPQ